MCKFSLKWISTALNAFLRAAFGNKREFLNCSSMCFSALPEIAPFYSHGALYTRRGMLFHPGSLQFLKAKRSSGVALGPCQLGSWTWARERNTRLQLKQMLNRSVLLPRSLSNGTYADVIASKSFIYLTRGAEPHTHLFSAGQGKPPQTACLPGYCHRHKQQQKDLSLSFSLAPSPMHTHSHMFNRQEVSVHGVHSRELWSFSFPPPSPGTGTLWRQRPLP